MSNALRQHAARSVRDPHRKSLFAMPARRLEPGAGDAPENPSGHPLDAAWLWPGWLRRGRMHLLMTAPFLPRQAILRDLADRLGRGCPPRNVDDARRSSARRSSAPGSAKPCRVLLAFEQDRPPKKEGTWAEADRLAEVHVLDGVPRGFDPMRDGDALMAFQKQFHYDLLILPIALDRLNGPAAAEQLFRVRRLAAAASITPLIVTPPRQDARRRVDATLRLNDLPHLNRISEQVDTILALSGAAQDTADRSGDYHWHHLHQPCGPVRTLTVGPDASGGFTWQPIDPAAAGGDQQGKRHHATASAANLARAVGFLEAILDQPQPRNELFERARAVGIGTRALWAAAKQLGVRSYRVGFGADGCHYWTRAA